MGVVNLTVVSSELKIMIWSFQLGNFRKDNKLGNVRKDNKLSNDRKDNKLSNIRKYNKQKPSPL